MRVPLKNPRHWLGPDGIQMQIHWYENDGSQDANEVDTVALKVRCAKTRLSNEEILRFGSSFNREQIFDVDAGTTYEVVGLLFTFSAPGRGTGSYVVVAPAEDHVAIAPLQLFEVVDHNIPSDWRLNQAVDEIDLFPEEFLSPYFFDRLSDQEPAALTALSRALAKYSRAR